MPAASISLWVLIVVPLFCGVSQAQNYTIPSSWRKPSIPQSIEDRIGIASAAMEKGVAGLQSNGQFINTAFGIAGNFYAQMARFDSLTKQTKYRDQLKGLQALVNINDRAASGTPTNFHQSELLSRSVLRIDSHLGTLKISELLSYGYAAVHAYKAYNDGSFLPFAEEVWNVGQVYTLSSSNINTGFTPVKDFSVQKQCLDVAIATGVRPFHTFDGSAFTIQAPFSLSSLLAEATSNNTYLEAAKQSMDFIRHHLYFTDGLVRDGISARQNDSCGTFDFINPYNSGLTIEGLAILASVTQDSAMQQTLWDLVSATIAYPLWQNADGLIAAWYDRGDENIVRGLSEVYERITTPSDFRSYVQAYIAVQYNAVVDQGKGSNIYGTSWIGPPTTFDGAGQTSGATVLMAGILLSQSSNGFGGSPGAGPTDEAGVQSKSTSAGAIAGAATRSRRKVIQLTPFIETERNPTPLKDSPPPMAINTLPSGSIIQHPSNSRPASTVVTPVLIAPSVMHSSQSSDTGRPGDEISKASVWSRGGGMLMFRYRPIHGQVKQGQCDLGQGPNGVL
uniref:Glycoside hydrolase family 76 protein n=1 Tax=Moniliophthora roreri TaxID=221103 RepID=A0A0W0FBU1_MONRR